MTESKRVMNLGVAPNPSLLQDGLLASNVTLNNLLARVQFFYPSFDLWFNTRVMQGLSNGERRVFVSHRGCSIVGLAIAKRAAAESKLCTLWVAPHARKFGIGGNLASAAFAWLETERPLFSVPEEAIGEFEPLLRKWRFIASEQLLGYYRPSKTEFVFNGRLSPGLTS